MREKGLWSETEMLNLQMVVGARGSRQVGADLASAVGQREMNEWRRS